MDSENDEAKQPQKKPNRKHRTVESLATLMVTTGGLIGMMGAGEVKSGCNGIDNDNAITQRVDKAAGAEANGNTGGSLKLAHDITNTELDFHNAEVREGVKTMTGGMTAVLGGSAALEILRKRRKQKSETDEAPQR